MSLFTKKNNTGFTIAELLIVVSILAIIITGAFGSYRLTQRSSRDGRRMGDLEKIRQALELYRTDNGTYPTTGGGGWIDVSGLDTPLDTYIDTIPSDPSRTAVREYRYRAKDLSGTNYFGYCLEADVEVDDNASTARGCSPQSGYDYTVGNP